MKNSFETREEYLVSKLMLNNFLYSKQIKSKLGTTFIESRDFSHKTYQTSLKKSCFYLRLNLRHFEEYMNSIHEGTNRRLMYNSAQVGPNTNIEKALAIMCNTPERNGTK